MAAADAAAEARLAAAAKAAAAKAAADKAAADAALANKPDPTKTAYADLTPAQRAAMSNAEKTDYIQAAREAKMAADAAARAATDPMKNFQERPDAPPADDNYIYYYAWVGGVNTGSWKLYRAPNTQQNASYKARAVGGETQATANSAVGANALVNQPTVDVKTGEVTTKTPVTTTPVRPAGTPAAYVYDSATKTWVKPPMPSDGKKYDWDDTKGWTLVAGQTTEPPNKPGKAWVVSPDGKSWIKPTKPADGKEYDWNDDSGWTLKVVTSKTIVSTTYIGTGKDRKRVVKYSDNTTETFDDPEVAGSKTIKSTTYTGAGAARKRVVTYTDGTSETFDDPEVVNGNSVVTGNGFTQKDIDDAVKAALAKAKSDAEAAAGTKEAEEKAAERASTIAVLQDRFKKYGLTSLASKIKELAIDGATEATITLQLQETPEYQMRFAANADRIKKNLTVLSPAEYLNAEDEYRQRLREYGLKEFDTDEYVRKFISNDTSLTEISNRIVTAVQRVQNADPAVIKQLKDYYGITSDRLVAYVLDPEQQFEKIKLQVSAAEIGVEANKQGLISDAAVSEQLAKQGITQAEAQKGYATIADILPTAEKLSSIYGKTMDTYGQAEGEQEVFNSLASAQRKRQKLSAAEIAQFSGSSGLSKTSLLDETRGKFQIPDMDLSAPCGVQVRQQEPASFP